MIKVKEINQWLYAKAPLSLCESWDNSGFLVGNQENKVEHVMFALDCDLLVIKECIEKNVDMLVTHHPLFLSPLTSVTNEDVVGKKVLSLIQNNIALFTAHTNFDKAMGGMNDILAEALDLIDIEVLDKEYEEKLYKLVVFVPTSHAQQVRDKIFQISTVQIGNYESVSFNTTGIGTFKPLQNSNPFIGKEGITEYVEEVKIETIIKEKDLDILINEIKKVHPYEEVAYDIIPLYPHTHPIGLGRKGNLKQKMPLSKIIEKVKNILDLQFIHYGGDPNQLIRSVGVITGSGMSYLEKVRANNLDLFITGDVKYHDAQQALEWDLPFIDAGHYGTEFFGMKKLYSLFKDDMLKKYPSLKVSISEKNQNYIKNL